MMRELSPHEQSIVAAARNFGETVIGPNAETWERQGRVPGNAFKEAAEKGLCRLLVPGALGGLELSVTAMATVMEILSSHCFASAFSFVVGFLSRRLPDFVTGRNLLPTFLTTIVEPFLIFSRSELH